MIADPHKPLRDDVRLLGELLGDTLGSHGGEQLFETVERVRALSKASRAGDESKFLELTSLLTKLPVEAATPLARAFAHFLNLANVAEQHHRIRRRRAYQAEPDSRPQPPRFWRLPGVIRAMRAHSLGPSPCSYWRSADSIWLH